MNVRKLQIESTLKRAVSEVLTRQISDPRIVGLISITHVDVSPDLHEAYVYVSVLPEQHQKRTLAGLRHATGYIHQLVKKAVALKTVPRLDFRVDESLKKEAVVLAAIQRAKAKDLETQAQHPSMPEDQDDDAPADSGPEDFSK